MNLFFGIDGGGTHSRITVIDEKNTILYKGENGCMNIHATDKNTVEANLSALIEDMLLALQASPKDFSSGCLGSAGLDSANEKRYFKNFFTNTLTFSCPLFFCNDSITALVGGLEKTEGFILISGTGAIASALHKDRSSVRAGGWGHILGDEGSGYWIGCQGIIRGIRSSERRDSASFLPDRIRSFYAIDSFRELFPFVYTSFDKAKIADFAKTVFEEAKNGDIICKDILQMAADELVSLCVSVYEQSAAIENKELVFSGGILEHEPEFCQILTEKCAQKIPEIKIVTRRNDPAFGACLLAKHFID